MWQQAWQQAYWELAHIANCTQNGSSLLIPQDSQGHTSSSKATNWCPLFKCLKFMGMSHSDYYKRYFHYFIESPQLGEEEYLWVKASIQRGMVAQNWRTRSGGRGRPPSPRLGRRPPYSRVLWKGWLFLSMRVWRWAKCFSASVPILCEGKNTGPFCCLFWCSLFCVLEG